MRIPELHDIMMTDRWNIKKEMPWTYIRKVFEKHWDANKPVLVEKGPPNLIRAEQIEKHFNNSYFIVMMRNPYAWCESMIRRRRPDKPISTIDKLVDGWVWRAKIQIYNLNILHNVIQFRYEDLCDVTDVTIKNIIDFIPEIIMLDANLEFEVHSTLGKKRNPITNTNSLAFARLTHNNISEITNSLRRAMDVMYYFGYELMDAG